MEEKSGQNQAPDQKTGDKHEGRLPDGTFAPGYCGNPKGRPRGKSFKTCIREEGNIADPQNGRSKYEVITAQVVADALDPNSPNHYRAISLIADIDKDPKVEVEMGGRMGLDLDHISESQIKKMLETNPDD